MPKLNRTLIQSKRVGNNNVNLFRQKLNLNKSGGHFVGCLGAYLSLSPSTLFMISNLKCVFGRAFGAPC